MNVSVNNHRYMSKVILLKIPKIVTCEVKKLS